MTLRNRWRKILSYLMLGLTGVCAVVAVVMLFLILGYLVFNGWRSVDWDFVTKLPSTVAILLRFWSATWPTC